MAKSIELDIEGQKLVAWAYNEDKPNVPIIFIHGITSSISFWEAVLPAEFTERYRWYSLSLPGHYPAQMQPNFREDQLTADMLVRVMSEAVARLVGQKPAIIVGHSTGGYAALHLAAHAPGVVKAVCSISGFVQGRWHGVLGNNQAIAALPLIGTVAYIFGYRLVGVTSWIWSQSWRVYTADAGALFAHPGHKKAVNGGYPHFRALDLRTMALYFRRFRHIDISAVLPQIRVPLLLLTGDKDPIVLPSQSRLIAEKVASSELVVLAGAGHVPMLERADEFNRTLTKWLEKYV